MSSVNPPVQAQGQKNILAAFAKNLQRESHVLKDRPDLLWQQMFNRLQWEPEPLRSLLESAIDQREGQWTKRFSEIHESKALIRTIEAHLEPVEDCIISADGEFFFTIASLEEGIKVWDFKSGDLKYVIDGVYDYLGDLAVTPDGSRFLSLSGVFADDEEEGQQEDDSWHGITVWDSRTGKLLQTLKMQRDYIDDLALSLDGRMLFTASSDNTVKVFDFENGHNLFTLKGNLDGMNSVAVTPDKKYVIGGSSDIFNTNLLIWELERGELITIIDDVNETNILSVTPDGSYLISAGWVETRIWELPGGELLQDLGLKGVNAAAITPDGRYLITGMQDTTIRVIEIKSGQEKLTLEGHTEEVQSVAVSPDGMHILSGSFDGTLKMWELAVETEKITGEKHSGSVREVAVTPDGSLAVSCSTDGTLKIWNLQTRELVHSLEGHTEQISSLAVTPDSRLVISASFDNTLKVWDLKSGEELHTLRGHLEPVFTVAVSPDGTHAISGSDDKTLRVWNLVTGKLEQVLEGHLTTPYSVKVTGDGSYIVSLGRVALNVWDFRTGDLLHTHEDISSESFALTPDGTRLVTWYEVIDISNGEMDNEFPISDDYDEAEYVISDIEITQDGKYAVFLNSGVLRELMVFDLEREDGPYLLHNLSGHTDALRSLTTTLDGRCAVSGSIDNSLRVWDLESGDEIALISGVGRISCCAVTPDGRQIVAGDEGGQVHILELENFAPGPTIVTAQKTHQGNLVLQCKICLNAFDAETAVLGTQIACGYCGTALQVNKFAIQSPSPRAPLTEEAREAIDTRVAKESDPQWLAEHDFFVTRIALSPDSQNLIAGSLDGTVWVWDLESGDLVSILQGHEDAVIDVAVSPDNLSIISASLDASIKVWDLRGGDILHTIKGHKSKVRAMVVSPDGEYIFSAGEYEKIIKAWDLVVGDNLYTIQDLNEPAFRLFVTPDCKRLLALTYDAAIHVWELKSGEHLYTHRGHGMAVRDVAFTSDSRYLLSSSDQLRFWDLENGRKVRTLDPDEEGADPVAIMPGGKYAISGTYFDSYIKIWDLNSGKVLHTLEGHEKEIDHLLFTPDNRNIISSSLDHTLKMWDFETGEELRTFTGHEKLIRDVLITPDGSHIISSSEDNTIRVWDLHTGGCRMLFPGGE